MRSSMNVQIREFNTEDISYIYELNRDEMGYDYPMELTRDKLEYLLSSKNNKIFVATIHDIVVGYVHANDYDVIYAPHMKNIMGIAVSSKYRGNGIGMALLSEVEYWAKETGAYGIRLVSGVERSGAHEFYRYCGYEGSKRQISFKKILR